MANAGDLERTLRADLPVGTQARRVLAYLAEREIEHSGLVDDGRTLDAIWRDTERRGLTRRAVQVRFRFDAGGRLEGLNAREQFTGP